MTSVKRFITLICLLIFSLPIFAQKKYTEKDLAALKQTLMQSVAGKSKEVQVMVDQILFCFHYFSYFDKSVYVI